MRYFRQRPAPGDLGHLRRSAQNGPGEADAGRGQVVKPVSRSKHGPRAEKNRVRLPVEDWGEPKLRDRRPGTQSVESFKCGHCKRFIGALPSGGHHRNHCPICLYSRHVDAERSGDRQSRCRALMEPVGAFQRPNGEHVLVHRCMGCGFERFNRIAADDDFDLVLSLPELPARVARRDDN